LRFWRYFVLDPSFAYPTKKFCRTSSTGKSFEPLAFSPSSPIASSCLHRALSLSYFIYSFFLTSARRRPRLPRVSTASRFQNDQNRVACPVLSLGINLAHRLGLSNSPIQTATMSRREGGYLPEVRSALEQTLGITECCTPSGIKWTGDIRKRYVVPHHSCTPARILVDSNTQILAYQVSSDWHSSCPGLLEAIPARCRLLLTWCQVH